MTAAEAATRKRAAPSGGDTLSPAGGAKRARRAPVGRIQVPGAGERCRCCLSLSSSSDHRPLAASPPRRAASPEYTPATPSSGSGASSAAEYTPATPSEYTPATPSEYTPDTDTVVGLCPHTGLHAGDPAGVQPVDTDIEICSFAGVQPVDTEIEICSFAGLRTVDSIRVQFVDTVQPRRFPRLHPGNPFEQLRFTAGLHPSDPIEPRRFHAGLHPGNPFEQRRFAAGLHPSDPVEPRRFYTGLHPGNAFE